MITKFKYINNLAVFQNFDWDLSVRDKEGQVRELKEINILYGRNYSGKTTLSRIVRSMETGELSDKYENPQFSVAINKEPEVTQSNLKAHNKTIRVFNEDFVRDNLKCIINSNKNIEAFAIMLGGDNSKIEKEIKKLESEIGSNEEGKETGLHVKFKSTEKEYNDAHLSYYSANRQLDNQLQSKAIDREIGIKYKPERFGDQNYSTRKIESDIKKVLKKDFVAITNKEQEKLEKLINENPNIDISTLITVKLNFDSLLEQTKELVQRKVGVTDKIEELVKDVMLHEWVKKGRLLHKEKRQTCAFCGNQIASERWVKLEKHFDEESDKLEIDIDELICKIEYEKENVINGFKPNKELFYSHLQEDIQNLTELYSHISQNYNLALNVLLKQLSNRKKSIVTPVEFEKQEDLSSKLSDVWNNYDNVRKKSNDFTVLLKEQQDHAKRQLLLKEVLNFVITINYNDETDNIASLKDSAELAKTKLLEIKECIKDKQDLIKIEKSKLNDEAAGANKVNEYLNDFFGHRFLSLQAIEGLDDENKKLVRFEIIRDGRKAHHLSEGECRLIAFCYFMAKLEDTNTQGYKPIIWIDDPISSLDGNHVFFVYSLINTEIVSKQNFEQLFISTHNLDFLKYLKRLPKADVTKETKTKYRYLVIQRMGKDSTILLMPDFLREYVTEFNFLFAQIYKCSDIIKIDDKNYGLFYNFANNARKFLEVFLYYKFPDNNSQLKKMQKFFGDKKIPAILTDRINNEYSHLCGVLERGGLPIEVPEMNSTAKLIMERIETLDKDQYESLLKSIGEGPDEESSE